MNIKKKFFNPELNKTDEYTEVWKTEYITVKDEKNLKVINHYWKDSSGELWGDFDNPMENVHRSFDAYRKKKNYLSSTEIKAIRQDLGFSVRKFAELLGISTSTLTQIENNHRIQTKYQDVLFRSAPFMFDKSYHNQKSIYVSKGSHSFKLNNKTGEII